MDIRVTMDCRTTCVDKPGQLLQKHTKKRDRVTVWEGSWKVDRQRNLNTMIREGWKNSATHGHGSTYQEGSQASIGFLVIQKYVACHTKDGIDSCEEVMREWRKMEWATKIIDLKLAYLQIDMNEKLWRYQLVEYKGQIYCLTRLGFGLNSATKIMTAVLKTMLTKDETHLLFISIMYWWQCRSDGRKSEKSCKNIWPDG